MRQSTQVDSSFLSYQAEARGYVYFFLDRPDSGERSLIKADQVALEVYWSAPDRTHQRIVGRRDEELLPTDVVYHLDHLTVVQDEFADVIRLGDGDEVRAVVHPAAPGSEAVYDFRLTDSLTISFSGSDTDTIRVYEVEVRPTDPSAPGIIGTLYLDRDSGAIVRMSFTFTPTSYVDPQLDYIRITLENSLQEGRYWLPYRQESELRRELPLVELLGGSVIRSRFEVGEYVFNQPLPPSAGLVGRVSAVPPDERRAFPFEAPLFAQIDEEGLSPPPTLEEIRQRAREIVADQYLSGLARVRFYVPSTSHAVRYDRAEGLFLGAGLVLRPTSRLTARIHAGHAFSRREPTGSVELTRAGRHDVMVRVHGNELRDLGPVPGASGVMNSLSAAISRDDFLDPWFSHGVSLAVVPGGGSVGWGARVRFERHRSAAVVVDDPEGRFRPVRPIDDGDLWAADLEASRGSGERWRVEGRGTVGRLESETYGEVRTRAVWSNEAAWRDFDVALEAQGGWLLGEAPAQALYLLGGQGTLLGHPYRAWVGDRFWLLRANAARSLLHPWVSARVFAGAGWTALSTEAPPDGWSGDGSGEVLATVGVGLALAWDLVNVDVGRGLPGGRWSVAVSSSPAFFGWL